jgi:hypothetical protein
LDGMSTLARRQRQPEDGPLVADGSKNELDRLVGAAQAPGMRGYGQFCPVALGAEVFAERWTPLILRELFAAEFRDARRMVLSRLGRAAPFVQPRSDWLRVARAKRRSNGTTVCSVMPT